jgi:hypothetical protein
VSSHKKTLIISSETYQSFPEQHNITKNFPIGEI